MKKLVMLLAAATATNFAVAQSSKITSASRYLEYGPLTKAKSAIDEAAEHPKTKGKAKTEMVKGEVYYALAMDTTEATAAIRQGALETSKESFIYALKNDDGRVDTEKIKFYLQGKIYGAYWDRGAKAFQTKDFQTASSSFASCAEITTAMSKDGMGIDTNAWYNAARASQFAADTTTAIAYYSKLKDTYYDNGIVFYYIADLQAKQGDTEAAFATIAEGRQKFPENQDLLIKEFNMYVAAGKMEEALTNIDLAVQADPTNELLLFNRGIVKEENGDGEGALADYLKVLEINPNNKDVNKQIGAYYNNQGVKINDKMNALPLDAEKEYDELKAKRDEVFKQALPYLEKAYELDPSDVGIKSALMQLYSIVGMLDKYQELKNK